MPLLDIRTLTVTFDTSVGLFHAVEGIDLSVESREVSEGVVLDYDAAGNLVGIDIDHASKKVDLRKLILSRLPGEVHTIAA